jgi:hypothetical protein
LKRALRLSATTFNACSVLAAMPAIDQKPAIRSTVAKRAEIVGGRCFRY